MTLPIDKAADLTAASGMVCPPWCGNHKHVVYRQGVVDSGTVHPDDAGVYHYSPVLAMWSPTEDDADEYPIRVYIEGFRHDNNPNGFPDEIVAENVYPGFEGTLQLPIEHARRVAHALLAACDTAEETA